MTKTANLIAIMVLAVMAFQAPSAVAAPAAFNQALDDARRALDQKDPAGTLDSLRRATALAWNELPFTALNVHLTAAPPSGYGQFLPRVDNVYRPSEPLILYLEPVGFAVRHDPKTGVYSYNLTADFNLVDAWGRVVGGRRDFGRFGGESRSFPDRFPLTFTYSLSGLPPGDYRVETTLRDLIGKQSHTVVTPLRIEGP
ncbi:MAG: hypothetical protein LDL07_09275 [Desulfarculus sp.]|nr:hypothetical protein [Desulfarculus sp.]